MTSLDWWLVGLSLLVSVGVAAYFSRRAGRSEADFFLGGRKLPWWLAGTSMVATTFAADTPLAVTELVAQSGIAGNWLWWYAALGGMLTVFFFARLWRRSGVTTDVALVELRYSGPAAAWLRGVKAVLFGLVLNAVIIGWVVLAMETVVRVLLPELADVSFLGGSVSGSMAAVGVLVLVVAAYALLAGLEGIVVVDAVQFVLAMAGSVVLAVLALKTAGGMETLQARLPAETFAFLPQISSAPSDTPGGVGLADAARAGGVLVLSGLAFAAYVGVQWWASWYPGAEPGGGGYVAQRMLAARSEQAAVGAALWFTVAHYCVRPWPWVVAALCALVLYPEVAAGPDARSGYVLLMRDVLPPGLLGLMVAAFTAAFLSTLSTQLNWGSSYLVHDLYLRFVRPDAGPREAVRAGRVSTVLVAVAGFFVATRLGSIAEAWGLVLSASAGLGGVLLLRWYWWRVNAWSELVATLVPLALVGLTLAGVPVPFLTGEWAAFPANLFGLAGITTAAWLAAAFLAPATAPATLDAFYRTVRPGGPGWAPVARRHPDVTPDAGLGRMALRWLAGCGLVYLTLFGTGHLVLGRPLAGGLCLLGAAALLPAVLGGLGAPDDRPEDALRRKPPPA